MPNIRFPSMPFRDADDYSRFLSRGLLLAYLMHEGRGSTIRNYGSWGQVANLELTNAQWTRQGSGLYGLQFNDNTAIASNTTINTQIPKKWSYAVWVKSDVSITSKRDIFTFYDSGLPQTQSYADVVGVWSRQKRSIGDTYTVMPPEDYPDDGMRLIVSVFHGIGIPPVQLRTEAGLRGVPRKPTNFQTFNTGEGIQPDIVTSISLGNNPALSAPWRGTIGPFYFWDRPISLEEVQALQQDPYMPFRRSSSQLIVPSLLVPQANTLFQATEDPGNGVTLSSDDDLFIFVKHDVQYSHVPDDELAGNAVPLLNIGVVDGYTYVATPTDELHSDIVENPVIEISDGYTYVATPTDEYSMSPINIPVIEITDGYTYINPPDDELSLAETKVPVAININEDYIYPDSPTEEFTHTDE